MLIVPESVFPYYFSYDAMMIEEYRHYLMSVAETNDICPKSRYSFMNSAYWAFKAGWRSSFLSRDKNLRCTCW